MRILIMCFLLAVISGCASGHTVLVNQEGNEYKCDKIVRYGMLGTIRANKEYDECIEGAQQKGYKIKSQD